MPIQTFGQSGLFWLFSTSQVPDTCYSGFRRFFGKAIKPVATLQYDQLATAIQNNNLSLGDLETFLLEFMDYQDGIVTRKISKDNYEAYGIKPEDVLADEIYIRDARNAKLLTERIKPNHFIHNVSNLLLRSLNIVRGVEHVLDAYAEKYKNIDPLLLPKFKDRIKTAFVNLISQMKLLEAKRAYLHKSADLNALEEKFNEAIVSVLVDASLAEGLAFAEDSSKKTEALLIHYRYLGSTLKKSPATKTISTANGKTIVQTVDPITEKIATQKPIIQERVTEVLKDKPNDPYALANHAFLDRLTADDSQLSPQLRFKFPETVRQAFSEKTETFTSDNLTAEPSSTKTVIRSASTAYVGKDINEEKRLAAAERNIEQIRQFASKKFGSDVKLHHMPLLENTKRRHNQDIMCDTMKKAAEKKEIGFSLMPVSFYAMMTGWFGFNKAKVTAKLTKEKKFGNSERVEQAAHVATTIEPGTVLIYGCASNQNRAGTVALTAAANQLVESGCTESFETASEKLAESGHEMFAAAVTCPGSRGMKSESQKWGLFSKLADKFFYGGASSSRTAARLPKDKLPGLGELIAWRYDATNKTLHVQSKLIEYVKGLLNNYLQYRQDSHSKNSQKKIDFVTLALEDIRKLNPGNFTALNNIIKNLKDANDENSSHVSFSFFNSRTGKLGAIIDQIQAVEHRYGRTLEVLTGDTQRSTVKRTASAPLSSTPLKAMPSVVGTASAPLPRSNSR